MNNTDALVVLNHINNTSLFAENPPVIRITADVKSSIPAAINNTDYFAIRQAAKSGWGFFDIPKWVFSGPTNTEALAGFDLTCANITRNIRGLCGGDVNGTYVPVSGFKASGSGIELISRGSTPMNSREIVFPVFAESTENLNISAITLALEYDTTFLFICGVTLPGQGEEEPWFETSGRTLRIGWLSADPVSVDPSRPMMLIRAKVKDSFTCAEMNNPTCFSLNENEISEMADRMGNVYSGIRMFIPKVHSGSTGFFSTSFENLAVYPNPVKDQLYVEFPMEREGSYSVMVQTLAGTNVYAISRGEVQAGWHKERIDLSSLSNGVYLLNMEIGDSLVIRKIIVNR